MIEMLNKRNTEIGFAMDKSLPDAPWPVAARGLMSEREKSLYQDLISLYPDHKVFVQVALSQLVDVARNDPDRMAIRGRFKQLVADFVLCRPDLTIVAVIELDDRTHLRPDRKWADARKSKALADAGLRLVRIPAGAIPSLGKLKALIEADRQTAAAPIGNIGLTLAEPVPTFGYKDDSWNGSPFGAAMSRKMKRALWKIAATLIFAITMAVACCVFLPQVVQHALGSMAPHPFAPHNAPAQLGMPLSEPKLVASSTMCIPRMRHRPRLFWIITRSRLTQDLDRKSTIIKIDLNSNDARIVGGRGRPAVGSGAGGCVLHRDGSGAWIADVHAGGGAGADEWGFWVWDVIAERERAAWSIAQSLATGGGMRCPDWSSLSSKARWM